MSETTTLSRVFIFFPAQRRVLKGGGELIVKENMLLWKLRGMKYLANVWPDVALWFYNKKAKSNTAKTSAATT